MKTYINKITQLLLVGILSLGLFAPCIAQDEFAVPKTQQLVIDEAGVLSNNEITALKQKLNKFSSETSTQILVYTISDLNGYDPNDFAQRIGESYGVGSKENDNGIVILFKPKTTTSSGQVAIQVGYGIEHLLPDATINQIIDHEMIPAFKQGDIYGGINNSIDICISLTKGEYTANYYNKQTKRTSGGGGIFLIIMLIAFFSIFGRSRKSRYSSMGTRSNLPLWTALFLMGSSSQRGSGWNDFSSGSGSFGGGGGFGGFGGGSFGGGGASGSW